ncbi:hemolysin XhlA family protein [Enterocloster bolteae]|uniref:hemolysin XhlA family protein n=1 Tax=Enterocloster bolteae TaxID=208479 RepID=UPI00242E405C|nr:hemolysin XhlA family protein [Enterocloster bolteae]
MSEVAFEREVLDRLTKIEVKLDSFDAAKKKTYDNENDIIRLKDEVKNQGDRIVKMEDSNKWLHRTTAGAVIASLVAIVFALVQAGIGL